jgi:hypothetical protein
MGCVPVSRISVFLLPRSSNRGLWIGHWWSTPARVNLSIPKPILAHLLFFFESDIRSSVITRWPSFSSFVRSRLTPRSFFLCPIHSPCFLLGPTSSTQGCQSLDETRKKKCSAKVIFVQGAKEVSRSKWSWYVICVLVDCIKLYWLLPFLFVQSLEHS